MPRAGRICQSISRSSSSADPDGARYLNRRAFEGIGPLISLFAVVMGVQGACN